MFSMFSVIILAGLCGFYSLMPPLLPLKKNNFKKGLFHIMENYPCQSKTYSYYILQKNETAVSHENPGRSSKGASTEEVLHPASGQNAHSGARQPDSTTGSQKPTGLEEHQLELCSSHRKQ